MGSNPYSKFANELCRKYVKENLKVFDYGCSDGFRTSIVKNYYNYVIGGDFENRTRAEYSINFREIGMLYFDQ